MAEARVMTLTGPWAAVAHLVLAVLAVSVLMPIFLVISASFKPPPEIYGGYPWPVSPTSENYLKVFDKVPFGLYLWNSFATTALRVGGQLVIAFFAAYAFAVRAQVLHVVQVNAGDNGTVCVNQVDGVHQVFVDGN
jgi:ABC-type glycerol-3-phosphate transport system permease component